MFPLSGAGNRASHIFIILSGTLCSDMSRSLKILPEVKMGVRTLECSSEDRDWRAEWAGAERWGCKQTAWLLSTSVPQCIRSVCWSFSFWPSCLWWTAWRCPASPATWWNARKISAAPEGRWGMYVVAAPSAPGWRTSAAAARTTTSAPATRASYAWKWGGTSSTAWERVKVLTTQTHTFSVFSPNHFVFLWTAIESRKERRKEPGV